MSIEDTAERIIERLDELPRSERVRYLESVFDGLKKRTHERVANLEFAIGKLRNALIEYVPEPLKADSINLGTTAMIKMAADAFIVSDAAQQQLKIRIDQFTAERTRAERSERREAVLSDRIAKLEAVCRDARSTIPDGKPGSQNFKVRAALDAVLGR